MLDLETWGQSPGAVIVAIGAVRFDVKEGTTKDLFYAPVSPESCVQAGLRIEPEAMRWWLQQGDKARLEASRADGMPLAQALSSFATIVEMERPIVEVVDGVARKGSVEIWGNGSSFDNAVLAAAYVTVGMKVPWIYPNERCFRTLRKLYSDVPAPEKTGVAHTALNDARYQALHAIAILRVHEQRKIVT